MDPSWPKYQLPKANRDLLFQFYCNNLEKTVKYFKAEMEDLQVIAEIRAFEMMPLNPMTEKMKDLFKETLPTADIKEELQEGLSVIVAIDDYAIGFSTGFKGEVKEADETFTGFKADYAEDCNALTKVPAEARMIKVMIKELRKVVKFHIPIGPYYSISRISIQKEFLGHGFGKILWRESMRLAKKNGILYAQAECSAVNSTKLAESLGLRTVFVFPFDRAIVNGKPALPLRLRDGLTGLNLLVGKIDV
ncbi:unnamed protein product [Bursaphelenchus xylophilus]|uniref:(pine wood nematode) hypothetical protein n=1 Tax=Bursaphelenchus xylophilus TaxID=6326 RepID=A0A7I8X9A0_BURXY|nr:unnamed protein product [Bursaphelenchus xylophilus]CAG9131960.1 unnamed protein product [Bursaphelenchus xylophilus]